MIDPFLTAAGPAPARGREALLRQLALLGVASSIGRDSRAAADLAATLLALDAPEPAAEAAGSADGPWAPWWRVLATGQAADAPRLPKALAKALAPPGDPTPDGREVARRLGDLADEIATLGVAMPGRDGDGAARARFAVEGHRARPERRMLLVGRSSAMFLVDPGWDSLRLVRLAPFGGIAAGNRAQLPIEEMVAAARRGDAGPGRRVPADQPAGLDPAEMLEALREDPNVRDRRLIALAHEVREERDQLAEDRARIEQEREALQSEKDRIRRLRAASPARSERTVELPRTPADAAALIGLGLGASQADIERAYRAEIAGCHPDRVEGLHPEIRRRASDLTVALNAARDMLLGKSRPARAARR